MKTNDKYMITSDTYVEPGEHYIRIANIGGISSLHDYMIMANVECLSHS